MAPFALLGPPYDGALRDFYTTTSSRDIFIVGSLLNLATRVLTGDALLDTSPLAALIAQHVDADLLREVGEAHQHGQRLYIGTVDLDALDFVVWNMGLIALSGRPESLDLFRQVMLASASIPIAFPPVFFDVESDGRRYDELHVDGGVGARVFYSGGLFRPSIVRQRGGHGVEEGREDIFVIHNGQIRPPAQPTRRTVVGITTRVLDASSRSAVIGALHRIYAAALTEQASFHWVTIPEGITIAGEETFDPVAMRALYDVGYRSAVAGAHGQRARPGSWPNRRLARPAGSQATIIRRARCARLRFTTRSNAMSNFWDVMLLILSSFVFFAYLIVMFQVVVDLFRDSSMGGGSRVLWIIGLIVLPFLTALLYILVRGRGVTERQRSAVQQSQSDAEAYIRQVAGKSPAAQIAEAKALLDAGTITQDEYAKLKAKAMA